MYGSRESLFTTRGSRIDVRKHNSGVFSYLPQIPRIFDHTAQILPDKEVAWMPDERDLKRRSSKTRQKLRDTRLAHLLPLPKHFPLISWSTGDACASGVRSTGSI
jgi:hypothetical protein